MQYYQRQQLPEISPLKVVGERMGRFLPGTRDSVNRENLQV